MLESITLSTIYGGQMVVKTIIVAKLLIYGITMMTVCYNDVKSLCDYNYMFIIIYYNIIQSHTVAMTI